MMPDAEAVATLIRQAAEAEILPRFRHLKDGDVVALILGILERRDFGGGRARYEPTEHGHHYHLIDVDTGRVVEFADPEHEALMQAIAERLGFELVSLRLELFGRRRRKAPPDQQPNETPEGGR